MLTPCPFGNGAGNEPDRSQWAGSGSDRRAQGIGFAIAHRLIASGAKVSLWDMNAEQLEKSKASLGAAGTVTVDITDVPASRRRLKHTESEVGPISILVNSAGVTGPNKPLDEYFARGMAQDRRDRSQRHLLRQQGW